MANSKSGTKMRLKLSQVNIAPTDSNVKRLEHLLTYATLAPSTHNTQPWKIAISNDLVKLYADISKKIPEADPTGRDMFLSLGAFIGNFELACSAYGLESFVELCPDSKDNLAAIITVPKLDQMGAVKDSNLLKAIRDRQNYRGFFDSEIDHQEVTTIIESSSSTKASATVFFDDTTRNALADLTVDGLQSAYSRPEFRQEIGSYINNNMSPKNYGLHGYSLRMNLPLSFIIPKIMKKKDIGAKLAALNRKSFDTASGVVVLFGEDSVSGWIETGKVLEDIMVRLDALNIRCSIYAAAIETDELRPKVAKLVGATPNKQPQLLFCIGGSSQPLPYSVREDVSDVML